MKIVLVKKFALLYVSALKKKINFQVMLDSDQIIQASFQRVGRFPNDNNFISILPAAQPTR